jgi:hypothetical protein
MATYCRQQLLQKRCPQAALRNSLALETDKQIWQAASGRPEEDADEKEEKEESEDCAGALLRTRTLCLRTMTLRRSWTLVEGASLIC